MMTYLQISLIRINYNTVLFSSKLAAKIPGHDLPTSSKVLPEDSGESAVIYSN